MWHDQIVPLLPLAYFQNRYLEVEKEVDERFLTYFQDKTFRLWKSDLSDAEIKEEYFRLSKIRGEIWFDPEGEEIARSWREAFRPALEMIREDFVRHPNCIAFDYNKVGSYYNGSLIALEGHQFLALEGPLQRSIRRFFYALLDSNAPLLVRLTPPVEDGIDKCAPYWEGRLKGSLLAIPRHLGQPKQIDYLATDEWADCSSIGVDALLELVSQARALYNPAKGPLAAHCSAGVGRTGTFIVAYCLLQEIDRQRQAGVRIPEISIERLVARLSLQRYNTVGLPQYLSLYRLVDRYVCV